MKNASTPQIVKKIIPDNELTIQRFNDLTKNEA
jgi:hypothetical protein